jgi:uncharacterized protein (TIGR03118 family)
MKTPRIRTLLLPGIVACAAIAMGASVVGMNDRQDEDSQGRGAAAYRVRNLVSDGGVPADHMDPDLVNAWGIAFNPTAVVWIADNGTGKSTLYNGAGVKQGLIVPIPPVGSSAPTGIVFSGGNDFMVTGPAGAAAARFIFATEGGTIAAWAPGIDPANIAVETVHKADTGGAVFKGLALAGNGDAHFLYAADFHNNRIQVFDGTFKPATLAGSFVDPRLPPHYAPFNIQNILGDLYVMYARQDEDRTDEIASPGFGFVSVFDANGAFIRRFASRGTLNAPWGIALAPADFGVFSNMLLIGNFGDGRISAFDLNSGDFRGLFRRADHRVLSIDGLWGLSFGNGVQGQPANTLFFTAGPADESHGLYGRIDPVNR